MTSTALSRMPQNAIEKLPPKKKVGVIVGIVLGSLVILGVTGFLIYWFVFRPSTTGFKSVTLTFGHNRAFSETGAVVPDGSHHADIIAPGDEVTMHYVLKKATAHIPVKWEVLDENAPTVLVDNYEMSSYSYTIPASTFSAKYQFRVTDVAHPHRTALSDTYRVEPRFNPTNGVGYGTGTQLVNNTSALITFDNTADFLTAAAYKFELSPNANFDEITWDTTEGSFVANVFHVPVQISDFTQVTSFYWRITSTNLISQFNKDHEITRVGQHPFQLLTTGSSTGGGGTGVPIVQVASIRATMRGDTHTPSIFPSDNVTKTIAVDLHITYTVTGSWNISTYPITWHIITKTGATPVAITPSGTVTNTNLNIVAPFTLDELSSDSVTFTATADTLSDTATAGPYLFQKGITWTLPAGHVQTVYGDAAYTSEKLQTANGVSFNGVSFQESCLAANWTSTLNIDGSGFTDWAFCYSQILSNSDKKYPADGRFITLDGKKRIATASTLIWYVSLTDMVKMGFANASGIAQPQQANLYMWLRFKDSNGVLHTVLNNEMFSTQGGNIPAPTFGAWSGSYTNATLNGSYQYSYDTKKSTVYIQPFVGIPLFVNFFVSDPLDSDSTKPGAVTASISHILLFVGPTWPISDGQDVSRVSAISVNQNAYVTVGTRNPVSVPAITFPDPTSKGELFRLDYKNEARDWHILIHRAGDLNDIIRGFWQQYAYLNSPDTSGGRLFSIAENTDVPFSTGTEYFLKENYCRGFYK